MEKWPGGADDVLTHVPLAARIPNGLTNHVIKGPVQTFDIMETLIDLAGIETDWVRFSKSLKNGMLSGGGGDDDVGRFVYSEGGFFYDLELVFEEASLNDPHNMYWPRSQEEYHEGSPRWVMARNLTHKLVSRPTGVSELYDLTSDPRELTNVYGQERYKDLQHELERHLMLWFVQTSDVPTLRNDARNGPTDPYPLTQHDCEVLYQPDPAKGPGEVQTQQAARLSHEEVFGRPGDYMKMNGIPQY